MPGNEIENNFFLFGSKIFNFTSIEQKNKEKIRLFCIEILDHNKYL